jgi:hypothetical protein
MFGGDPHATRRFADMEAIRWWHVSEVFLRHKDFSQQDTAIGRRNVDQTARQC